MTDDAVVVRTTALSMAINAKKEKLSDDDLFDLAVDIEKYVTTGKVPE